MYIEWLEKATRLGASIFPGTNWTWAENFPTREAAMQFMEDEPDMETRGIYESSDGTFAVRFR